VQVIDGDQRLWLAVSPHLTLLVLDYRGAPYLRFSHAGIQVNHNSAMYYLNQTPVAETPPTDLNASMAPNWQSVSDGHDSSWHDGRLHALATVALAPGTSYVGRWSIPVVVSGHPSLITGALLHAPPPSIVWFWPIFVLILCFLAARRVHRPELETRLARTLAGVAIVGVAVAGVGRELYGRPSVSVAQGLTLATIAVFVLWGARRTVLGRLGWFALFAISVLAIWEGVQLTPTLLNGFVLAAVPPFVARAAAVLCLGSGISLCLLAIRLAAPTTLKSGDRTDASDDASPNDRPSPRTPDRGQDFS
ncbi:MAG: hypothetical protein ACRDNK_22160, partial [Solirubrobacteraceae bacterium]